MTSAGFEPVIPASERPQTHALDSVAPGIGTKQLRPVLYPVPKRLPVVSDLSHNIPVPTINSLTLQYILILSPYLLPCLNECSLVLWGFQLKSYKHFSILPFAPNGPPHFAIFCTFVFLPPAIISSTKYAIILSHCYCSNMRVCSTKLQDKSYKCESHSF